jgi:16S rRNA (uracil1498-N3)-methyltransferase
VSATFHSPDPLAAGVTVTLGEGAAHHARVRRLEVGERVRLTDGAGTIAEGTIVRIARRHVAVETEVVETREAPLPVHLLVPVADRERMLWLAEKCAELAATSWRPVAWHRSRSVSPRGEGTVFRQKVQARMIAALEQSAGPWLPSIFPEATPERAIAAAPPGTRLLLDAAGEPALRADFAAPVSLVVGPEGGLEPDERESLVAAGFRPVSLGATTLRFETAALAALAVARAALALSPERLDA